MRVCSNVIVFVAAVFMGYSPINRQSSTSRKSCVTFHGHYSPLSSVVVMATCTCQPLLRHRCSSQLATVAR